MNILVLNCGSSSIKYQVLDMKSETEFSLLAKGLVERVGSDNATITHKVPTRADVFQELPIHDHSKGISVVLDMLLDKEKGLLESLSDIDAVGHRVAHGGEYFSSAAMVNDDTIAKIEKCCALAPLHNPASLLGIRAAAELMPQIPQVTVFDTSFHQTIPDYAYMYALPYEYYQKYGIRRYGFHGTSHNFVAGKACDALGWNIKDKKIITCHLGNGSSITAIKGGKSIDTSMGFTPLEGVTMGTRCGNIDPSVVTFIMEKEGLDAKQMNDVMNKKSGLLGLSGVSADNRDVEGAAAKGNKQAEMTHLKRCYDIKKFVGAYAAVLNGVDLIIMTGGIGENARNVRREVLTGLEYLGLELDLYRNDHVEGDNWIISTDTSKVKAMVVCTNEELVIARDTMELVSKKRR